jgi:hypothetical protein
MNSTKTISDLNSDCFNLILDYFTIKELFRNRIVCKQWSELINYYLRTKKQLTVSISNYQLSEFTFGLNEHQIESLRSKKLNAFEFETVVKEMPNLISVTITELPLIENFNLIKVLSDYCPKIIQLSVNCVCNSFNENDCKLLVKKFPQLIQLTINSCISLKESDLEIIINGLVNLQYLNIDGSMKYISGQCLGHLSNKFNTFIGL